MRTRTRRAITLRALSTLIIAFIIIFLIFENKDRSYNTEENFWYSMITGKFKVKRIIDGDSIQLSNNEEIRYIGINSPEYNEKYDDEATAFNKKMVEGKTILVERDFKLRDKYNRILAYVYICESDEECIMDKENFVNYQIVINGWAKLLSIPPDIHYQPLFAQAELNAKEKKIGIWK